MNRSLVDPIANAVLYEGYILYPYRPSIKNRDRWTFGGLYPRAFTQSESGPDKWRVRTECLFESDGNAQLEFKIRCLHLQSRSVGMLDVPIRELPPNGELD